MGETEFSRLLRARRKQQYLTQSVVAEKSGISLPYYNDFEFGRRPPPDRERLDKILDALLVPETERAIFYDLAGKVRSEAPLDLPEYINEYEQVRLALRLAKDGGNPQVWGKVIDLLEREAQEK
ncbi:MAG: helix-turn-helix domain-containing protein [Firmicutes bacterium]|nr:helix-turn-helix domain-containing protein [Bacillota bacterium]